jgi:Zn-dependent protease
VSSPRPSRPTGSASESRATIQALVSLAVSAYIGTAVAGDRAGPGVAAAIYVAILAGSVVLHEIGHALAVRIVGGTVEEFRLGFGPVVMRRTGRTVYDIRLLLIAGHVGWRVPNSVRRGQLLFVSAAGPAAHLVLLLVALFGGDGAWSVWRIDLLIANAGALLSNLIPYQTGLTTTAPGHNDGAAIAALLRHPSTKAPTLPLAATPAQRAAATSFAGADALNRGDRKAAESLLRQAMSYDPEEPTTRAFAHLLAGTPPDQSRAASG